jgi:hypothetical protein
MCSIYKSKMCLFFKTLHIHFLKKIENSLSKNIFLPLIFLCVSIYIFFNLWLALHQNEGTILSRLFWPSLLLNLNNSVIVMTGSEFIWAVFILTGLISVSDGQVMAITGFGFEVFLHNKQWALSQKSLWFILTY